MKMTNSSVSLAVIPGFAAVLALAAAIALAGLAQPAAAQQAPPAPGTSPPFTVPPTTDFTLPNGLGVTLVPYGQVPKVTIRLVTETGNVHEGPAEVWLADLTGDLMQQGTATRSAQRIATDAAAMGGSMSVSVGANQTSLGGEVLSEFGPEMIGLVADVVRNPSFPESELTRLKENRVRQVAIARARPQVLAQERFREVLYPEHAYGRLYPDPEMMQGYTLEQIRSFHAANFGARRSHLYVAGRFDEAAVEAAIRIAFESWQPGPEPDLPVPSAHSERAVHLVHRPGAVQSTIFMGLPVIDPFHEDYVALQVMNTLLGGAFASRITSNIREDKGYTYSPYSSISSRYRDAYWTQAADVTTPVTGASLHEIFYEIDRLRSEPPEAVELQGIQNYMAGTFVLQNSSRSGIIGQLSWLDLHGLPRSYLETYVHRVHAVTPEEVERMANTYIDPDRMTIVVVGDREAIEEQVAPYGELR